MQRIRSWLVLQRQAAVFLKSAEKTHVLGGVRSANNGPVLTCTQEKPIEPVSLFLCQPDGVIPISEDANKIYEDNKSAVEEHMVQQLSPFQVDRFRGAKKGRSSTTTHCMSDQQGLISNQCIQLAMAHSQGKPHFDISDNLYQMSSLDTSSSRLDVSPVDDEQPSAPSSNQRENSNLPTQEQLEKVKANISEVMPNFFKAQPHRYDLYTANVRFEDNYWGQNKIYDGVNAYASQLLKLKMKCNLAYCSINLYIINISSNHDEGTIRVRWTLKGIPQLEGFKFWKFNLFNVKREGGVKDKMSKTFKVHDGVNTFWVNKDGAIYKHRMDKVIPDEEKKVASVAAVKISKMLNNKLAGATDNSNSSPSTKYRS